MQRFLLQQCPNLKNHVHLQLCQCLYKKGLPKLIELNLLVTFTFNHCKKETYWKVRGVCKWFLLSVWSSLLPYVYLYDVSHFCAYLGVLTSVLFETALFWGQWKKLRWEGWLLRMPETEGGEKIKQRLLEPGIEELFKCWLQGCYMPLVRLWLRIGDYSKSWIFFL